MSDGRVAVLDEEAPPPTAKPYAARRIRYQIWAWRASLWAASWAGRAIRRVLVDLRLPLVTLAGVAGVVLAERDHWPAAGAAFGFGGVLSVAAAALNAKRRVLVGDFVDLTPGEKSSERAARVDLANLLQVELSRLGSLFRVVEDRRAVSSGLGPRGALDATLSVDDLVGSLQEAVSAETRVGLGPLSIPVAPLMTIAGRAVRRPRLTGSLHRDGDTLILTAQQPGRGGMSWRVTAPAQGAEVEENGDGDDSATGEARLSAMVTELALRVFTDLALGREVRWQASKHFVDGLHRFRACLRTPRDRKVNLKDAEQLFLDALSEDEDFPLVYYNLGVVYTELHGLAVAAGRAQEAEMYLSAAEVSFGWAIDKDRSRWETYQAYAQTQFQYKRYATVIDLCERICQVHPPRNHRARAYELRARALIARDTPGDLRQAIANARKATNLAVRALFLAQLFRTAAPGDDDDRVPRCKELVGACAHTFATCYSRQLPRQDQLARDGVIRWRQEAVLRRTGALFPFAERYLDNATDLHYELGVRALNRGRLGLARSELQAAVQSDPTRPTYAAALALALARGWRARGKLSSPQREEIRERCTRALRDMAGAFFPYRDADACELVARVYDELAEDDAEGNPAVVARQLRDVAQRVRGRLGEAVSGASVSGFFLEALQNVQPPWTEGLSDYGVASRDARALLIDGQRKLPGGPGDADTNREAGLSSLREALRHAERATALNPLSSLAWETLGDVHAELWDFRNAREAWGYALGRDPDNPELYDKIGSSHWQLAFQGQSAVDRDELHEAGDQFNKALVLYGSGSYEEQLRAHYRLAKLHVALRQFPEALPHLRIVEAVAKEKQPPLVGWLQLGLAYLEQHAFSDCEYYLSRVIAEGGDLAAEGVAPDAIIGDRLDEREWPLALTRAWGHLGTAFSFVERDGDRVQAEDHVRRARELARQLPNPDLFPTRIYAACDDCEGMLLLKRGELDDAMEKLHAAVGGFPFSRSYLNLALVYEERARRDRRQRENDVRAARRFITHCISLGPTSGPTPEVQEVLDRLEWLAAN